MPSPKMLNVKIKLSGFGTKAHETKSFLRDISSGTSLAQLWDTLKTEALPNTTLANIEDERVLHILNGVLVPDEKFRCQTILCEGDTITFMVLAFGG